MKVLMLLGIVLMLLLVPLSVAASLCHFRPKPGYLVLCKPLTWYK